MTAKHDPKDCRLCAPYRHPVAAGARKAVASGLARQTRSNGENGETQ